MVNKNKQLYASMNIGNAYVGGLVGYVYANANLDVGVVQFDNSDSEKSLFTAQSLDSNSQANVYTAGLFWLCVRELFKSNEDFKNVHYNYRN